MLRNERLRHPLVLWALLMAVALLLGGCAACQTCQGAEAQPPGDAAPPPPPTPRPAAAGTFSTPPTDAPTPQAPGAPEGKAITAAPGSIVVAGNTAPTHVYLPAPASTAMAANAPLQSPAPAALQAPALSLAPLQAVQVAAYYPAVQPAMFVQPAAALQPAFGAAPAAGSVRPFAFTRSVVGGLCRKLRAPAPTAAGGFATPPSGYAQQAGYVQQAYSLVHVGSTATTTTQVLHSYAAAPAPAPAAAPAQAPLQSPQPPPVQASPQQAPRKGLFGG